MEVKYEKSDIEIQRRKYPEKGKTFPSIVKKVIKTEVEQLPEKVTKAFHLKENPC